MIVKNEEAVLARCLDCVKNVADEIVVVDTGSTDRTKEIAARYTDKVCDFEWCDDFSAARNFSFSFATGDYIMWLDADDVIEPEDQERIKLLKQSLALPDSPDCVMCKYVLPNAGHKFYFYRERILRRVLGFVWSEPVHEVIAPMGKIEYSDIAITHKKLAPAAPKRNLKIYRRILRKKATLSPRSLYYYARELYFNGYYRAAITQFKRLLTRPAWVENKIDACVMIAESYLSVGEPDNALKFLHKSFAFSAPRAKTICLLAQILLDKKEYASAIEWLLIATKIKPSNQGWCEPDYHNFYPYLYLSLGYYYTQNFDLAKHYHRLAKRIHPDNPIILNNDKFFV